MSQMALAHTDSIIGDVSQFTVDAGTTPVVPTAGGGVTLTGLPSGGIVTTGSANTVTFTVSGEIQTIMTGQTTDATPTALTDPITLADNSAITIEALVVGASADYSAMYGTKVMTLARKEGAAAPQILSVTPIGTDEDFAAGALNATWVISGSDLQLQVTGEATTTINWRANVRYVIQNV